MKTFLINIPQRVRQISQGMDAKAALCGRSWLAYNDEGKKQVFIFQPDGTLYVSTEGIVAHSEWVYISSNNSVIVTIDSASTMYHPVFFDDTLFALEQDGTTNVLLLLDEKQLKMHTLAAIQSYIDSRAIPAAAASLDATNTNNKITIAKKEVRFGGEVFTEVSRNSEGTFFVSSDGRYAFDEVLFSSEDDLLVKKRDGKSYLYKDNSLEDAVEFEGTPRWKMFMDGLVVEGLLIWSSPDEAYLKHQGKWERGRIIPTTEVVSKEKISTYLKIGDRFLKCNKEGVSECEERDVPKSNPPMVNDSNYTFLIGVLFLTIAVIVALIGIIETFNS